MAVLAKICGLKTEEAVKAAIAGGARYVGFVCYPPSPRHLELPDAAELSARAAGHTIRVGLFVDPTDALLGDAERARSEFRQSFALFQKANDATHERSTSGKT